jgi:hypothetical protein
MQSNGAGGTSGGTTRFVLGIALFVAGLYLLLKNIYVQNNFGFGNAMYAFGGFSITSGMLLIPFVIGVAMLFFNYKYYWLGIGGWCCWFNNSRCYYKYSFYTGRNERF